MSTEPLPAVPSARFWERGRVAYNLFLTAVVAAWVLGTWPHFQSALTVRSLLLCAVLAGLANALYCAAYPVDWAFRRFLPGGLLGRLRWALWSAGMLLALLLANYWIADEIYPG
jgi:hypothetical protein